MIESRLALPRSARWQSGYAEDCKSLYVGSIPARASTSLFWGPEPKNTLNLKADNIVFAACVALNHCNTLFPGHFLVIDKSCDSLARHAMICPTVANSQ